MQAVGRGLNARQWCCLWDAVHGSRIAPTATDEELWVATDDGVIAHPGPVISSLSRRKLLRKTAGGFYVATQLSAAALLLPVRDNVSLVPLANAIASALGGGPGM